MPFMQGHRHHTKNVGLFVPNRQQLLHAPALLRRMRPFRVKFLERPGGPPGTTAIYFQKISQELKWIWAPKPWGWGAGCGS